MISSWISLFSLALCTGCGTPLNLLTTCYFARSDYDPVLKMLLTINSAVDMMLCAMSSAIDLTGIVGREDSPFQNKTFCVGWSSIYASLITLSSHIALLLAVCRLLKVIKPNYKLSKGIIYIFLAVDIVIIGIIRVFNAKTIAFTDLGYCSSSTIRLGPDGYTNKTEGGIILHAASMALLILPCPVILLLYIITIGVLLYQHFYYIGRVGARQDNTIREQCIKTICIITRVGGGNSGQLVIRVTCW